MRQITKDAVRAFMHDQPFKLSNTQVSSANNTEFRRVTTMYLHGNIIAHSDRAVDGMDFWIQSARWFISTTKERLNGLPGVRLTQKNFQWYLNGQPWDGSSTFIEYKVAQF